MRTRSTAIFAAVVTLGLAPLTATADCQQQTYNLSEAQQAFLDAQGLEFQIPVGIVPDIQRCDTNADNVVDIYDIQNIALARNQPAKHPDDAMDWDVNGVIDLLDVRGCQLACAQPRCAPMPPQPVLVGGTTAPAPCTQTQDFDGDGTEDFVGIYENTGAPRAGNYNLELVILNQDESGNVQQTRYPYSGQVTQNAAGEQVVNHHISVQPAGPVNLSPGNIVIDRPAVVSYRFGRPKVIYYWANGQLNRAFYGVDD